MLALGAVCDRGICELLTIQAVVVTPLKKEQPGTGRRRIVYRQDEEDEDLMAVMAAMAALDELW